MTIKSFGAFKGMCEGRKFSNFASGRTSSVRGGKYYITLILRREKND